MRDARRIGPWMGCVVAVVGSVELGAPAAAQSSGRLWSHESDGSWIAEVVSLGNSGTQVFSEYGDYLNDAPLFSSHDADPPAPVWSQEMTDFNFHRAVDSAADTDVHVAMHQVYADSSHSWREAVLRKFSSSSGAPDWEYSFPVAINSHPYSTANVSADGMTIVGLVYDSATNKNVVCVFGPATNVPQSTSQVDAFGPVTAMELSEDGSTALLVSNSKLVVLSLPAGTVAYETFLFGYTNRNAIGISGDGEWLAYGTDEEVLVYKRTGGVYAPAFEHPLPAGTYCGDLALSRDGSTLAVGINFTATPLRNRVRAVDLDTQEVTMQHTWTGAGSFQNRTADMSISSDGMRFALGTWGDEAGLVPEVAVYRRNLSQPIFTADLEGSVQRLDLSPDGNMLAVASKGTHANEWGAGGSVSLFAVRNRDLVVEGVPGIGQEVTLVHDLRPGDPARVLFAPRPLDPPQTFPGVGTLYIDRDDMTALPMVIAGPDGAARTPYSIPNDPNLIGRSLYFQGLEVGPRDLSTSWVKLTILP